MPVEHVPPAGSAAVAPPTRAPNDPRQYDDLADQWWRPDGAFAVLHWLAAARAGLIPSAARPGAVLVDLGCGAGLLAPHLAGRGYRHIGVDLVGSALEQAAEHGVVPVRADVTAVPLHDGCADVVSAGEILEHVPDWRAAVAEACRLLRPGGLLVLDTLNATWLSRLLAVRVAERFSGVPRGIHDPRLFVDSRELIAECARHGVPLRVRGVRPAVRPTLHWLLTRAGQPGDRLRTATGRFRPGAAPGPVANRSGADLRRPDRPGIVPTWSTAVLYQGRGVKGERVG